MESFTEYEARKERMREREPKTYKCELCLNEYKAIEDTKKLNWHRVCCGCITWYWESEGMTQQDLIKDKNW